VPGFEKYYDNSTTAPVDGKVDFYINGDKGWLIEFCISDYEGHVAKFEKGGAYHDLIKWINKWMVVHFVMRSSGNWKDILERGNNIPLSPSYFERNNIDMSPNSMYFVYDETNFNEASIFYLADEDVVAHIKIPIRNILIDLAEHDNKDGTIGDVNMDISN